MEMRATEFQNLFQIQNNGTQQHNIRILDAKGSDVMNKITGFPSPLLKKRPLSNYDSYIILHTKGSAFKIAAFTDHCGGRGKELPIKTDMERIRWWRAWERVVCCQVCRGAWFFTPQSRPSIEIRIIIISHSTATLWQTGSHVFYEHPVGEPWKEWCWTPASKC